MAKTAVLPDKQALLRQIQALAHPALLLDSTLRVDEKNRFCAGRLVPLRKGAYFKRYVSAADFRRIAALRPGENLRVDIELPSIYSAFVFCSGEYYLVELHTMTASLRNRIGELMLLNREMNETLFCQLALGSTDQAGFASLVQSKTNRILRADQHISEFLRIINGIKQTRLRTCHLCKIFDSIIFSLKETLKPIGSQLFYVPAGNDYYGEVSETDLNLVICLILNNCIRFSGSGKIHLELRAIGPNLYFTASIDSILPPETARTICEGDYAEQPFVLPDGWLFFELLLTKKLCEFYGWAYSYSSTGDHFSNLRVTLSIPLTEKVPAMEVRSKNTKNVDEYLRVQFANLLDKSN